MRVVFTTLAVSLIVLSCQLVIAARRNKRTDIEFNSDVDVSKYLRSKNKDMEVFRCKKVVMVQWLHSVLPYVDLQCEVLGEVTDVMWYYNNTLINTAVGGTSISLSQPHYRKRTFYNTWFDYKLRLLHVTEKNNGPYTMKLESPTGVIDHGDIMLEVMTDYREEKWLTWMNQVDKDQNLRKNSKRSLKKLAKRREKELRRQIRRKQKARKHGRRHRRPQIFEGQ